MIRTRLSASKYLPAAFLSLAALLVASQVQAETVKEIRIAVPDISAGPTPSGAGIVDVLRDRQSLEKEFEKDGIKVRWDFFKGAGPAINEALANGQEDFAYLGDFPAIIGKASGLDTRLLSAVARDVKLYLAVQPGSGITSLEALKGKRVAIFRGTATQLSFASALAHQGLKESDYKVVNLDYNAANAALAAKQIDATWSGAGVFALKARGLAEVPVNTVDLDGAGSMQAVLVGRGAFVDEHPEWVARLIKAQQPAITWLRNDEHKQDYINLVSRLASYPPEILTADAAGQSLVKIFAPQLDAPFLANLQRSVDLALDAKLIRKGFEVKTWAEPKFIDDALQAEAKQASTATQSPQASR